MKTCIEKRREACVILENRNSSSDQIVWAKNVLNEEVCLGCSNPLTIELSLDDLMCDFKP